MKQDRIIKLIDLIYDAASDSSSWRTALEEMVALTGGTGADLAAFDLAAATASIQVGVGTMNEDFKKDYKTVAHIDPFLIRGRERRMLRPGVIGIGEHLVPLRELEQTEFYDEFGRRHEYVGGVAAILAADTRSVAAIGISRQRNREFGQREGRLMRTLMPHLQRAWHFHRRLAEADRQQASFADTLNNLAPPVFIVGAAGTVVFANDTARQLLAAHDGLTLDRGTLRAATPADTSALNTAIRKALLTAASDGLEAGGVLQVRRPSGRRGFRVIVSPLPPSEKLAMAEPRALLFVIDPEDAREPDVTILRRAYGLTPAEVEIATLLMQDRSVKEMSQWLGISVHTVRFHLKQMFAKTGTSRQGALVRLLSTTAHIRRIGSEKDGMNQ